MTGWDAFNKYVGVQGVLALLLVGGYIVATFTGAALPNGYGELMTFVTGFYFAKNGTGIIASLRGA